MRTPEDNSVAFVGTALLHLVAFALMLLAGWMPQWQDLAAPGEPVETTIQFTAADVRQAQASAAAAAKVAPPVPPAPTPTPPPQPKPQAPQDEPDTVDEEAIVVVGEQPSEETQVREERTRQEQIDLTEELERQKEAENRQREIDRQLAEIRRMREEAAKITRMEEQRLRQLADARTATPAPRAATPAPAPSGARGTDEGLKARYKAAMNATARDNWNTGLAPELVRCSVRFRQIVGGEVINVEFMDCPYDAQGRESVERALLKTPMPYSGFETVFESKVTLTFCYPEEACQ
jgi:colicin import membrane protein